MILKDVLLDLNPTSLIQVINFNGDILLEGFSRGILDDGKMLDLPIVFVQHCAAPIKVMAWI